MDIIANVFPEFTPSEMEICRLILQGKKVDRYFHVSQQERIKHQQSACQYAQEIGIENVRELAKSVATKN